MLSRTEAAVFPLSGDPITHGHLDIIERAARIFQPLIVLLLNNPEKKCLFTLKERLTLAERTIPPGWSVKVDTHAGLLADYAYRHRLSVIVRGLRNGLDLETEKRFQHGHRFQWDRLETIYLFSPHTGHISSSLVKHLVLENGSVEGYVPLCVKQALEEKILGQFRIGVTGPIAGGKTHVMKQVVAHLNEAGISSHYLDLDEVVHAMYRFSHRKDHEILRESLLSHFGKEIFKSNGDVDRKKLSRIVFAGKNRGKLDALNRALKGPLDYELRNGLRGKKGLVFIDGTVLLENRYVSLVNNNFILIHTDAQSQRQRLTARDRLSGKEASVRIDRANTQIHKRRLFKQYRDEFHWGTLVSFLNSGTLSRIKIERLCQKIREIFPLIVSLGGDKK